MKKVGQVRGDGPRLGNPMVPYAKTGAMQRRGHCMWVEKNGRGHYMDVVQGVWG